MRIERDNLKVKMQKMVFYFIFILAASGYLFLYEGFSSCGKWSLLFVEVHGLLTLEASPHCRTQVLAHELSSCGKGLAAPWHVGLP